MSAEIWVHPKEGQWLEIGESWVVKPRSNKECSEWISVHVEAKKEGSTDDGEV